MVLSCVLEVGLVLQSVMNQPDWFPQEDEAMAQAFFPHVSEAKSKVALLV